MADGGRSNSDIAMRLSALMVAIECKTQSEFASRLDINQPTLNNYLKGHRRPDLDTAIRIQVKTGATLDWIYLGDRSGLPVRLATALPDLSDRSAEKAG